MNANTNNTTNANSARAYAYSVNHGKIMAIYKFACETARDKYVNWSNSRAYEMHPCDAARAKELWDNASANGVKVGWARNYTLTGKRLPCYYCNLFTI